MKSNFTVIGEKKLLKALFSRVARKSGGKELIESVTLPCTIELREDMPGHSPSSFDKEGNHIMLRASIKNKSELAKALGDSLKMARDQEIREFGKPVKKQPQHKPGM